MRILLISTYDLGHQPLGLANAAAWLRAAGHEVLTADLAVERRPSLQPAPDAAAFYLPMHTAARLAAPVIQAVRRRGPETRIACFGLYAPPNAEYLRSLGAEAILGGESEPELVRWAAGEPHRALSLDRLQFPIPDRSTLPPLSRYARLVTAEGPRLAGYTESSRGCKHLCRHCPVVPVYNGTFRVVGEDTVLADIHNQAAAGAAHITFGDPDFFNGPTHARRIVERLARELPNLTYDATIKIEHLLLHQHLIPVLKDTGCLFVTTAVESLDDHVLALLEKGHTRADFLRVTELFHHHQLGLSPTFIAFTPWTTRDTYRHLLATLRQLDLTNATSPVQLGLRLLIPPQSRLLELPAIQSAITGFNQRALLHQWTHPDPILDHWSHHILRLVAAAQKQHLTRSRIFQQVEEYVQEPGHPAPPPIPDRATIPYLNEPWYC
ncbi:MAG: radical SAM protein [Acidobacteria bacterium]|nr:radical SAM protein [Acidobacteriota bacterium]